MAFTATVYEFLRNDAADAKDYFLNFQLPAGTPLQKKNRLRRNQFGAWLGGPVELPHYNGKDKTFWSFNYEGTRQTQESVQQAPEASSSRQAFRTGDFSALLTPAIVNGRPVRAPIIIYDPTNGQPFTDASGKITNIIPAQPHQQERAERASTSLCLCRSSPRQTSSMSIPSRPSQISSIRTNTSRASTITSARRTAFSGAWQSQIGEYDVGQSLPGVHIHSAHPGLQRRVPAPAYLQPAPCLTNSAWVSTRSTMTSTRRAATPNFDVDSLGIGQFRVAVDNNRKFSTLETGIPPISGIIPGDAGARVDLNGIYSVRG